MSNLQILTLRQKPELQDAAAEWFHKKWNVPLAAYQQSMAESLSQAGPVPSWYLCLDGDKIIAGLGVIENDFHNRKDLAPNICAVYTEEAYRCQGIAGNLLDFACKDMKFQGIDTLYLITDHTSFYERYGWEFLCMVQGDGESKLSRMYLHREK